MTSSTPQTAWVRGSRPLSHRHERFAQLMALGSMPAYAAYAEVYEDACDATCRTKGPRLVGLSHICDRISFLQGKVIETVHMKVEEVVAMLEEYIATPVTALDENSPLTDEMTVVRLANGKTKTRVKGMSKKDAIDMIAKLGGWYKADGATGDVHVTPEETAARVRQVALEAFGRRGDVERVLRAYGKG